VFNFVIHLEFILCITLIRNIVKVFLKIYFVFIIDIEKWYIYSKERAAGYDRAICTPMFIAALFMIAKLCKQPGCPKTDQCIKTEVVYTHNGILLSHKVVNGQNWRT
jgi:hypothetical protein